MQPAGWAPQGGAAGAVGRAEPGQARPEGGPLRGHSRRLHKTGWGLPRERARSQQKLKKSKLELFPYF